MKKTIMKARVSDQHLLLVNEPLIASGGVDEVQIRFEFCDMWTGGGKTAVFYRNPEEVYHVPIADGLATVPHEVLTDEGCFYLGVMGSASNIRTTEVVRVEVARGAITTATADHEEPTPDIYSQLLAAYGKAEQAIAVERARIDELTDMRGSADGLAYAFQDEYIEGTVVSKGVLATIAFTFGNIVLEPGDSYYYNDLPAQFAPLSHTEITPTDSWRISIDTDTTSGSPVLQITNTNERFPTLEDAQFNFELTYTLANTYIPELADIRVGANGKRYATAGEAVRAQDEMLADLFALEYGILSDNKFDGNFDENGKYDYTTGLPADDSGAVRTSRYYEIPENTKTLCISFSESIGGLCFFYYYDSNKNFVKYSVYNKQTFPLSLTVSDKMKYYRISRPKSYAGKVYVSPVVRTSLVDADYEYNEGYRLPDGFLPLSGKVIVNFGDSIFANSTVVDDSHESISTQLIKLTGATVHNCAFGGCRMASHPTADYDAFSMYRLADAVASGDWSRQDTAMSGGVVSSDWATTLNTLKGLDFSRVDIITIAFGTNDFAGGLGLESDTNNFSTNHFAGALRHSIETLLGAYPNLRIFVCTPIYRFWMDSSNVFTEDSDTKAVNDIKLIDFVAKTKEVCLEYHLPCIDNYELGMNKLNRGFYFPATDGTHPNANGKRLIAEHIAKELF